MSIKHHFVRLAEKIHGRKCTRCVFNHGGRCNLNQDAFSECWQSVTRPNFVERQTQAPGDLSEQEKHELGKIVESLQEASATAQDAGLLDNAEPRPIWEDKTESGLLEED